MRRAGHLTQRGAGEFAYAQRMNMKKEFDSNRTGSTVTAVIVTYNRLSLLKKCLAAVAGQSVPCDVMVINNASTDGTTEYLNSLPHVRHVLMPSNLGGAGGFAEGFRRAAEAGSENIWVMDDDCIPGSKALEELLNADRELGGREGWLSSRCLWTDGRLCPMNVQRETPYRDIGTLDQNLIPAQMASFVSLFIPAGRVMEMGLPFREFVIWTDDWEYTRRISRKYPCYVVWRSEVIHAMKNAHTVNIAMDTEDRLPRYRYFYRNDVVLYRREGFRGWCWIILKDLWHSLQCVRTGRVNRIPTIWKGMAEGCRFDPKPDYPHAGAAQKQ